MREAAILRIVATVAGVIIIITAGVVGTSALKRDARQWWQTVLGIGLAVLILFVGYRVIADGNFWAFYS